VASHRTPARSVLGQLLPPPRILLHGLLQVRVSSSNLFVPKALVHGRFHVVASAPKLGVRIFLVAVHERFHALAAVGVRPEEWRVHLSVPFW